MAQRETSVVRQRRLRAELRRFREESGQTQRTVAEALGWSTSKVIRIETGAVNVATSDVRALLHYYGINDRALTEDLVAATRSRDEGWWAEYRRIFNQQFLNFLGYEDSAMRIRGYMTLVVPGLLQTEEYATALLAEYEPERYPDLGLQIRMRRQKILDRQNCPELQFILDEAVIHRWLGGPEVMARQLLRLKDLARHPRISLRIVPFTAGMYVGMQGSSFTMFEFPSDDDVVTIEDPQRFVMVDDSETIDNYIRKFSKLQRAACPERETDKIIDSMIDRMRLGATLGASGQGAGDRTTGRGQHRNGSDAKGVLSREHHVPVPQIRGHGPAVGLVTAIPEESVAMRALLDDVVERYIANDPAQYLLGTLPSRDAGQPHQVALTRLGATATNAAANGCANLIRSFPSIVVIVMVGIAAGVPNPSRPDRHVRLGDIVVATQVVDFDHVWAVEGGVKLRRPLSLPSPRLTLGADMLRSDELSGVHPWERWLDLSRCPDLVGYGRPTGHTDVLHDDAGRSLRHPRRNSTGHRKGLPKVHYGAIGSSDRSFNDATVRDRLAAQHGLIALEMEGAGVGSSSFLNGREWFVVRGISDYGDSHRSEQWRRHAALVAAAYVRALLAKCLPLETQPAVPPPASDPAQ